MPNTLSLFLLEAKLAVPDSIQYNVGFSEGINLLVSKYTMKNTSFRRHPQSLHNDSLFLYNFRKIYIQF
jgi:hypothetical protein